jgi:hypothetical protein
MNEVSFPVRRTNPRFLFSADAEAVLPDGKSLDAKVFELSLRGCYIDTIEPLPVGTHVRLHVAKGNESCDLSAKVIYLQAGFGLGVYGMGIVFEDMPGEDRLAIESWLDELARDKAEKNLD